MSDDRRLIEDYLPIEAISAEASREKSVRKGHISTLHLWWARRPLVACRAAVYGALVPASQFVPNGGTDVQKKSLGRANAAKFIKQLCQYPGSPHAIKEAQEHILKAHAERLTHELQNAQPNGLPLPRGDGRGENSSHGTFALGTPEPERRLPSRLCGLPHLQSRLGSRRSELPVQGEPPFAAHMHGDHELAHGSPSPGGEGRGEGERSSELSVHG